MKNAPKKGNVDILDFDKYFLQHIAIDTVILGFREAKMMVLLLQYKNTKGYALPGGFIFKNENINDAARRILKDRTGLDNIYLEQFYTFGDTSRQDKSMQQILKARGIKPPKDHFLLDRFISIGYYALVNCAHTSPTKDALSDDCKWVDIKKIPQLIQDHNKMIERALHCLRKDLDQKLIALNLMPETFTMNELQTLYETIQGKKIRRTSFQRKIINMDIVTMVKKKMTGAANKAPYLYKFKLRK